MDRSSLIDLTHDDETRLLRIARASIELGHDTKAPQVPQTEDIPGNLGLMLGSFVTLTRHGDLRGCVGSLEASRPLAQCVAVAAFNAAFHDTRFPPLSIEETAGTLIEISILSRPEPIDIDSETELLACLNPDEDGLLLEDLGRRSTFLPKVWDKLTDPQEFVAHLKAKAGFNADYWSSSIRFYRYNATSIAEPGDMRG